MMLKANLATHHHHWS